MLPSNRGPGLYKMGALAAATGLSPELLRAWERRHALLDPVRTPGGHRLYTSEDLAVLRRVQILGAQGLSIGEIAGLGRQRILGIGVVSTDRAEGGAGLETLLAAAEQLDEPGLESRLERLVGMLDPLDALRGVLQPAAERIGLAWARGHLSVASEHLFTAVVERRVEGWLAATPPGSGPRVLVTCLPDERHALGGLCLSWLLKREGFDVLWLGAALPLEDLESAVAQFAPSGVALSVSRLALLGAWRDELAALARRRRAHCRLWIGGRAIDEPDAELSAAGVRHWLRSAGPWDGFVAALKADLDSLDDRTD